MLPSCFRWVHPATAAGNASVLQPVCRLLAATAIIALSACASGPQLPERILVPVASSCVPTGMPPAPTISTNAELLGLADRELVLRIAAERLELISFSRQAEAVLSGCQ